MRPIPRVDLTPQREALRGELDAAIERVMARGVFVLGPEVEAFEREFAEYCGAAHCVTTGSGTDALRLALEAAGVGAGDEVVTVSQTFVATGAAIALTGAVPVFAEVERDTYTMDPASARAAIGPATRAIVPVHLYGQCADMDALRSLAATHGLLLVDDAAQAHGATWSGRRAGSLGDATAFSFYPTKNIGAYGDGGAVVTDDGALAERVRLLRNYGAVGGDAYATVAGNSRLDELQAAVLRVKLRFLGAWNEARRRIAATYAEELAGLPLALPITAERAEHVFHLYPVRTERRGELRRHLDRAGIASGIHYRVPVHVQPAFAYAPHRASLPLTERYADELLSLPMFPELRDDDARRVAEAVRGFFGWAPSTRRRYSS